MSSCIEETFPTDSATSEQLGTRVENMLYAIPAAANRLNAQGGSQHYDWGYGSIMHIRDVMTEDMAIVSSGYDHYRSWSQNLASVGESYATSQFIWNFYWKFVQTSNDLIRAINPDTDNDMQLGFLGVAKAFRAFQYLDLAQMFEFLENDKVTPNSPSGNSVLHLTVPIMTDSTSVDQSRNNPRVSREKMAAFILSDLQAAEKDIPKFTATVKTMPHLDVVYGLYARYYMWLGDYANAKIYAHKAIDTTKSKPMTQSEWLSTSKGFNDISKWMWGSQLVAEDDVVQTGILNWTSWMSNETSFGYSSAGPWVMMNANTYNRMDDNDFRKLAWKAPEGGALNGLNDYIDPNSDAALGMPAYSSLKFRPAEGNMDVSSIAAASAYPLMRVEEMYLIEAEAAAHINPAEGKELIESFMQTYRDPGYVCTPADVDGVVEEIVFQKRIELWGEGLTYFDVKRLNMSVTRGYPGTNFTEAACFNTTGRPAWMNFVIVQTEKNSNKAMMGYENPSPAGVYTPWIDPSQKN
jgi:hypothetical protein